MNEIAHKIRDFKNRRRYSINYCLWTLGAPRAEVYQKQNNRRHRMACNASCRSIYDLYSKQELRDWVAHLRKKALVEYHPDRHRYNKEYYENLCQEINKIYAIAMRILNLRKHRRMS